MIFLIINPYIFTYHGIYISNYNSYVWPYYLWWSIVVNFSFWTILKLPILSPFFFRAHTGPWTARYSVTWASLCSAHLGYHLRPGPLTTPVKPIGKRIAHDPLSALVGPITPCLWGSYRATYSKVYILQWAMQLMNRTHHHFFVYNVTDRPQL